MIRLPESALIGVIHLPPLPGSPTNHLPIEAIIERALADAKALEDAGFDAVIVENMGDAPFTKDRLEPGSIAAMTLVAAEAARRCKLKLGINALRNDAMSALGIASAVGAAFIRVNVHCGVSATDQGLIEGQPRETLNYRRRLGAPVAILADVHVKHATPISHADLLQAAKDTAYRAHADGLIVTGAATGCPVNEDELNAVRAAVPDRRIFVGSGANAETVRHWLECCGGVIVGSALKPGCDTSLPIDEALAAAFVRAAGRG